MRALKTIIVFLAVTVLVAMLAVATYFSFRADVTEQRQIALAPFYETPAQIPDKPGTLIRHEPLTGSFDVPGATAHRILYTTQGPKGQKRVSSGMVFVPTSDPAKGGRKIVAWAHPTVGMGDPCAPSRSQTPTGLLEWLPGMIARGWIVAATDYAGLGTEGVEEYLIAESEVHDVVNAVRAATQVPDAQAGSQYGVYGHSQGGHAAMWSGTLAPRYAPELELVGVAGAAPAAPLADLVQMQWRSPVAWVIGAEVFESFPQVYPELDVSAVGTKAALSQYQQLADKCLMAGILESKLLVSFGEQFFAMDPLQDPQWRKAIEEQSAPPTPADMPALVIESVNDGVVLPETIVKMQEQWCDAGSDLQVTWLGPLRGKALTDDVMSHMYEGSVGGAIATTWFERLFAGEDPGPRTCTATPPLVP